MRRYLIWAAAVVLLATACGRPARQELIVATPADGFRTDGDRANLDMFPINANIFETLVRLTPDFQIEPWLAERWEYRGGNTWRFYLRRGVGFHDGQPFTAAAVKFSLDRLARTGGGSLQIGPDSTRVIDDLTVDITPKVPNLRLVDQLVHASLAPMIAPGTDVGTAPTGTGPFKFVEYLKDQRLVVERNDAYWGEQARLRRITFRPVPDDNTRWLALRSGEIDLMYDLPRELLAEAQRTSGIKPAITPPGASEVMLLNRSGKEPYTALQEADVRQALGAAIDRKSLVEHVWAGAAQAGGPMTPAALFGPEAARITGPAFDPARARNLLDGAGWRPGADGVRAKDGHRLSLTMINGYPPIALRKPMPELVQAQLKDVGIEVNIVETPELATYLDRLKNGEGDIFLERVAQNDANPASFVASFFYSKATSDYPKWFAAGPDYDRLVDAALGASDRAEATRLSAESMHLAIDTEAVVVPVAAVSWLFAMKDDVQGFVLHGSARHVRWAPVFVAERGS